MGNIEVTESGQHKKHNAGNIEVTESGQHKNHNVGNIEVAESGQHKKTQCGQHRSHLVWATWEPGRRARSLHTKIMRGGITSQLPIISLEHTSNVRALVKALALALVLIIILLRWHITRAYGAFLYENTHPMCARNMYCDDVGSSGKQGILPITCFTAPGSSHDK